MKRAVAILCAGILIVTAYGLMSAKDDKDAGKWQEKKIEKMSKDLNLTAEQKDKLAAIMKENDEKIKAEWQKCQEAVKVIREGKDQQIKAVLTPEQAQKYEKNQAERKEKKEKKEKKETKEKKSCGDEKK